MILFLCSSQPDYSQDLQIYEEQMASRRNDFTFTFNQHSGGYNLKRWNGGSNMPISDSMVTIQISPSQPTIFGDEKNEENTVKVMLTPPTPAKRERRAVLNNAWV